MIKEDKKSIHALLEYGRKIHSTGHFVEAEKIYKKVLKLDAKNAEAHFLLGSLAYQIGNFKTAEANIKHAIKINSSKSQYHNNLGLVFQAIGDQKKASRSFNLSIKLEPTFSDAINNLGTVFLHQGKLDQAKGMFEKALTLEPQLIEAWNNLGDILALKGFPNEAIKSYKKAIFYNPNFTMAHYNIGVTYKNAGNYSQALNAFKQATSISSNFLEAHQNTGIILMELGLFEDAITSFKKVLKLNPNSIEALYSLSTVQKYTSYTDDVKTRETLFKNNKISIFDKIQLSFSLGKIFEDLKNRNKSLEYLKIANRIKRKTFSYNIKDDLKIFDSIIKNFNQEFFNARVDKGIKDKTPIFIIGMPRSGTSLVEQILSSHKYVFGAGELTNLAEICFSKGRIINEDFVKKVLNSQFKNFKIMAQLYINELRSHSSSAFHITDKMPENFFYVGMIKLMMPNSKIIHCKRNPVDTCMSNFQNNFEIETKYAYDLKELGLYYCAYKRIMDHWHSVLPGFIYDLVYENLVNDPETNIRSLLDFCNLKFDPKCINFHRSKRPVKTASLFQVRQPIYKTSIHPWKGYEDQLTPLLTSLQSGNL